MSLLKDIIYPLRPMSSFIGRVVGRDPHFKKSETSWLFHEFIPNTFRGVFLGEMWIGGIRSNIISGVNEGKAKKELAPFVALMLFMAALILSPVLIALYLMFTQTANLLKLSLFLFTALPYFIFKHGIKKGLLKTGKYLFKQVDFLVANVFSVVLASVLIPMVLLFTPISFLIAKYKVKRYNQNHPLVQALLDVFEQSDEHGLQPAIDALHADTGLSDEQKTKYIHRVIYSSITRDTTPAFKRALMDMPDCFKILINIYTSGPVNREYKGIIKEMINERVDLLLANLPQDDLIQDGFDILKYLLVSHTPRISNPKQIDGLLEHLVEHYHQYPMMPNKDDCDIILDSFRFYKPNLIAADIRKRIEVNFSQIPVFFDAMRSSSQTFYVGLTRQGTGLFLQAFNEIDFNIKENAMYGCSVLQALIQHWPVFLQQCYGSQESLVFGEIASLLEKGEIVAQLINGQDSEGQSNLAQLLNNIDSASLLPEAQQRIMSILCHNKDIRKAIKHDHPDDNTLLSGKNEWQNLKMKSTIAKSARSRFFPVNSEAPQQPVAQANSTPGVGMPTRRFIS